MFSIQNFFSDPPDVEVRMEPSTPVKASDQGNVTLICNVTSGNPSSLLRVSQNEKIVFLFYGIGLTCFIGKMEFGWYDVERIA